MSGTPNQEAARILEHESATKASRAIRARVETIIHEDIYRAIADYFQIDSIISTVIERAINNAFALPDRAEGLRKPLAPSSIWLVLLSQERTSSMPFLRPSIARQAEMSGC